MGRLSSRLNSLKQYQQNAPGLPKNENPVKHTLPKEWTQVAEMVWIRDYLIPLPPPEFPENTLILPHGRRPEELLFYDTETTGLSGGAGNLAFLIGAGWWTEKNFMVRQFFLSDYPGEITLLSQLKEFLPEKSLYVSYNGRSFDNHLLRSRFRIHRIPYPEFPQLDLLYPCRTLWKGILDSCSLSSIETSVLLKSRSLDIPGKEVPDVWFDFLKTGETERLLRVFGHNLDDIVSLAELLIRLEKMGQKPLSSPEPLNRTALCLLIHKKDPERGLALLEELALYRNDTKAMNLLGYLYKKKGEREKAAHWWETLNRQKHSLTATTELAKYHEHTRKDPLTALNLIDPWLTGKMMPLTPPVRAMLAYRRDRLKKKIDKSPS